ncbi:hypothetical protein [uncultured Sphingomonas sp.]|uniref:hypothetical protein n=1 Tax=uncultured Sphingomonas sp. TaxID=158754 RepID=UPI0035C9B338
MSVTAHALRAALAVGLPLGSPVAAALAQTPTEATSALPAGTELKPNAAIEGELSSTDARFSGSGAAYDTYFFESRADASVDMLATATGFAPAFALFTADGEQLAMSSKGRIFTRLPSAGAFVLLVSAEQPEAAGRYRIKLDLLTKEAVADREQAEELNRRNLVGYEEQRRKFDSDTAEAARVAAIHAAALETHGRAVAAYQERLRERDAQMSKMKADYESCLAGRKDKCPTAP